LRLWLSSSNSRDSWSNSASLIDIGEVGLLVDRLHTGVDVFAAPHQRCIGHIGHR
jgi:hypothetical protein